MNKLASVVVVFTTMGLLDSFAATGSGKKCLSYFADTVGTKISRRKKTEKPTENDLGLVVSSEPPLEPSVSQFGLLNSIREHTEIRVDPRFGLFVGESFSSNPKDRIWVRNKITTSTGGQQTVNVEVNIPYKDPSKRRGDDWDDPSQWRTSHDGWILESRRQSREILARQRHLSPSDKTGGAIQHRYNELGRMLSYVNVQVSSNDPQEQLNKYLNEVINRDGNYSMETLQMVQATLIQDPGFMNQVRQYNSNTTRTRQDRRISLSNEGLERYFYFIPQEQSYPAAARILDIGRKKQLGSLLDCLTCSERNEQNNASHFIFLVEWIDTGAALDGGRIRNVVELNSAEMESIYMPPQREEIEKIFKDSLSASERMSLELATQYGLKTFGYKSKENLSDLRDPSSAGKIYSAGQAMNFYAHKHSLYKTARYFGKHSVVDLLNLKERTDMYYAATEGPLRGISHSAFLERLYDESDFSVFEYAKFGLFEVMSRNLAKDILSKFEDANFDFRFIFVVTEDGQIKVSPFSKKEDIQIEPEILRLAQGRRVYAGGDLYFDFNGALILNLNPHEYVFDEYGGIPLFYVNNNRRELNQFLVDVFALQTGRMVTQIGMDEGFKVSDAILRQMNVNVSENAPKNSRVKMDFTKKLSFGSKSFEEWLESVGPQNRSQNVKLEYAYYVLGVNGNTPWSDVKKKRKILLAHFHPDKASSDMKQQYTDISQRISEAFTIIDKNQGYKK